MPSGVYKKTEEHKRKMGDSKRGEKHWRWKGGGNYIYFKLPKGCRFYCMGDKVGSVKVHRLVMAAYLQRPLETKEIVHHINEDITDNRIEQFKTFKKSR